MAGEQNIQADTGERLIHGETGERRLRSEAEICCCDCFYHPDPCPGQDDPPGPPPEVSVLCEEAEALGFPLVFEAETSTGTFCYELPRTPVPRLEPQGEVVEIGGLFPDCIACTDDQPPGPCWKRAVACSSIDPFGCTEPDPEGVVPFVPCDFVLANDPGDPEVIAFVFEGVCWYVDSNFLNIEKIPPFGMEHTPKAWFDFCDDPNQVSGCCNCLDANDHCDYMNNPNVVPNFCELCQASCPCVKITVQGWVFTQAVCDFFPSICCNQLPPPPASWFMPSLDSCDAGCNSAGLNPPIDVYPANPNPENNQFCKAEVSSKITCAPGPGGGFPAYRAEFFLRYLLGQGGTNNGCMANSDQPNIDGCDGFNVKYESLDFCVCPTEAEYMLTVGDSGLKVQPEVTFECAGDGDCIPSISLNGPCSSASNP